MRAWGPLIILALVVACGSAPAGETGPDTTTATTGTTTTTEGTPPETTTPDEPGSSVDPGLRPLVDRAVADLAERLGVEEARIEVVSAELVVWPDSSLGCPRPGMQYLQVLTDGSRIRLSHDGTIYHYHTGGNTVTPFLCENPA